MPELPPPGVAQDAAERAAQALTPDAVTAVLADFRDWLTALTVEEQPGGTGVSPVGGTGVSPVQADPLSGGNGGTGVSPVGGAGVSPVGGTGVSPVARRVLIVDDNVDAAHSLRMLMEIGGHEAHLCYDGQSALTEAKKFRPEVVLLDIGLPGLDGLEVARRLRAMNLAPRPMLVALTGYGQNDDVRRSREAGFDHHFVKPTDPQALMTLMASAPQLENCSV
ncbi:MAG TPA: response regulator [Gemmataceae bacterium]|nr:response regulator [Gemmataceae bacterium]